MKHKIDKVLFRIEKAAKHAEDEMEAEALIKDEIAAIRKELEES